MGRSAEGLEGPRVGVRQDREGGAGAVPAWVTSSTKATPGESSTVPRGRTGVAREVLSLSLFDTPLTSCWECWVGAHQWVSTLRGMWTCVLRGGMQGCLSQVQGHLHVHPPTKPQQLPPDPAGNISLVEAAESPVPVRHRSWAPWAHYCHLCRVPNSIRTDANCFRDIISFCACFFIFSIKV